MLKDLDIQSTKKKNVISKDAKIATEIVVSIFKYVNLCLKYNKSKKEISPFAKTIIGSFLTDKTINGLNDYLLNMEDAEVSKLLNEIQVSLNKRRN